MAFRLLAKRVVTSQPPMVQRTVANNYRAGMLPRSFSAQVSAETDATQSVPSAFDNVVKLTLVDPNGAKRQISGMVGKTLHDACVTHRIDLGPANRVGDPQSVRSDTWTEPLFGEGPTTGFDHVVLHGNGVDTAEQKTTQEEFMLEEYWDDDEVFPESRLASMVTLTREMDGMIVYIPDRVTDDIP